MKAVLILLIVIEVVRASFYRMERGSSIHLQCSNDPADSNDARTQSPEAFIGFPGKPGKRGPVGPPGSTEPDTELRRRYDDRIAELEKQMSEMQKLTILGSVTNPASSCLEIKQSNPSSENGPFYIIDKESNVFLTYCDMISGGGGWTLVGSVHENNMKGRCTTGDRWSSEQGNSVEHPHGDGFWENRAVHGSASSSTSDDYKNSGYFGLNASDIMIWHVPNDTPMKEFESEAYLKYYTQNGFLQNYGGNLQKLFSEHYPMKSKTYQTITDNGPAIPVVWIRGNNAARLRLLTAIRRSNVDAGYVQFRAINNEQNAFALCSGVRMKPIDSNVEHCCIGSTSNNIGHANEEHYCGDLAALDWHSDVPEIALKSVIMIFYR